MHTRTKEDYVLPLEAGQYYHIYNRTNNKEALFLDEKDRIFFLKRYRQYLLPFLKTYAYCLLDNHFHVLVKVRSMSEILAHLNQLHPAKVSIVQRRFLYTPPAERNTVELLEKQFGRFFISYSTVINRKYRRSGNLFHRPYKRLAIESEGHFTQCVYYIHANPKKHGLVNDFTQYKWSSYHTFMSNKPTSIEREAVLDWFGGKDGFVAFHELGGKVMCWGDVNSPNMSCTVN